MHCFKITTESGLVFIINKANMHAAYTYTTKNVFFTIIDMGDKEYHCRVSDLKDSKSFVEDIYDFKEAVGSKTLEVRVIDVTVVRK